MYNDRDFYATFCITFLFGVFLVVVALLLYVWKKNWKKITVRKNGDTQLSRFLQTDEAQSGKIIHVLTVVPHY
jgi:hypothetical protein